MKTAIHIGNSNDDLQDVRNTILEILKVPHADQKTKQLALKTLKAFAIIPPAKIENVSLSNVNIVEESE